MGKVLIIDDEKQILGLSCCFTPSLVDAMHRIITINSMIQRIDLYPNKCIGCGICTTKCEFDAIHLNRELPECSTMRKSEDKLKYILPYGAKQAIKIKFAGKKNK